MRPSLNVAKRWPQEGDEMTIEKIVDVIAIVILVIIVLIIGTRNFEIDEHE